MTTTAFDDIDGDSGWALTNALAERMIGYVTETGTKITDGECTLALIHLLVCCIALSEDDESRVRAADTVMPQLIEAALREARDLDASRGVH